MGISRNTVKAALASDNPPKYVRAPQGSVADAFEPRIRELLQAFPSMPSTVIAERIGWPYSVRTLSGKVAQWRPAYLPPDPASRTAYAAGEIAQCDFWFPPVQVPAGSGQVRAAAQLPVLTMVTGYARWASAVLVPSRRAEDLFAGWWQLITRLGAVPGRWSGTARARSAGGGGAQRADCGVPGVPRHAGRAGDHLPTADLEAKGLVERLHDYLERSFLPGHAFASPADFNAQLAGFLVRANTRQHRALGCAPGGSRRTGPMIPLPPVAPATGWRRVQAARRPVRAAGRQRLLGPPVGIGRRIEVIADLDRVRVSCDGQQVADHDRAWARHQTITDPEHLAAARALRRDRLEVIRPAAAAVEVRRRADYDTAPGPGGWRDGRR